MRQTAILGSGAQVSNPNCILHLNGKAIIYSSSLAVYVLNRNTYNIEHILSNNRQNIICIAVSPTNHDLVSISTSEGEVWIWEIEREYVLKKVTFNSEMYCIWHPNKPSTLLFATIRGPTLIYSWDISNAQVEAEEIFKVDTAFQRQTQVIVIR